MPAHPNPHAQLDALTFNIRPDTALYEALTVRMDTKGRPSVAKRALQRYFWLLNETRLPCTLAQARRIHNALSHLYFDTQTISNLDRYTKLPYPLNLTNKLALADALEQVRSATYPYPDDDLDARLKRVGLVAP